MIAIPMLFLPVVLAASTTESDTAAASSGHSDVEPNNNESMAAAAADSDSTTTSIPEENTSTSTSTSTLPEHSTSTSSTALEYTTVAEEEEDDDLRSWLDIFGQVAKEYWTQRVIPPTDVECRWDWRVARCEPYCHCHYQFEWGDYHLGRSCRQRPVSHCRRHDAPLLWEELELLHHEEPEQEEEVHRDNKAKQVLIHTVKVLQSTRDYLQQWTQQLQEKTHQRYEQLQDKTCGDLLSTISSQRNTEEEHDNECIPPSKLTWKEQVLCRDLIEPMVFCEAPTNENWWQRLQTKFRNDHDDDDTPPPTFFAESSFPDLVFPGWSAGVASSDWTAGAAAPRHKHKNYNAKRRPMAISTRRNNTPRNYEHDETTMEEDNTNSGVGGGFARMSNMDNRSASSSSSSDKDNSDGINNDSMDDTTTTTTTTSTTTTDTVEQPTHKLEDIDQSTLSEKEDSQVQRELKLDSPL